MNSTTTTQQDVLSKIFKEFLLMWLLTGVGMLLGSFLPPVVAMGMSVLALILLIVTFFVKKQKTVNKIFFAVPFLMGFAFYFSVNYYLSSLGTGLVLGALLLTFILFIGLGFVGMVAVKKNLSGMGQFLFFALIILIVLSIIGIFFTAFFFQLLIAVGGVIIFCLYTLYDFNQIKHSNISADETTGYALDLYLDFINLFLYILRLINLFTGED